MKGHVLASKLRMPRIICNTIQKRKLLEYIHASECPIVIIQAGLGYGKTTFIEEYIQEYHIEYEWYQLERGDNELERFFTYFETLIKRQIPSFRIPEKSVEWSYETIEGIAEQILEQIESYDGEFNIIFDDFHFIQNPLIYEFLRLFLRYMRERIRIFFLIRGDIPGFLSRFILQGAAIVIGETELRITKEELEIYMQEEGMETEHKKCIESILSYSEGWPAAVDDILKQLIGVKVIGSEMESHLDTSRLSNYLLYEILNPLVKEQQKFMIESAVLERIVPEVCDYVLETENAENFLDLFVVQKLMIEKTDNHEYQYHPIWKEFLCSQVPKERKQEIWRRALNYYTEIQGYERISFYQNLLENQMSRPKRIKGNLIEHKSKESSKEFILVCFGGIRIVSKENRDIIRWRTRKTKEMFAYFWERQERWISKEEIIDVLWQEGDGQKLESLFHTTLSYLKRALFEIGIPNLIHAENKKYRMECTIFSADSYQLLHMYEDWRKRIATSDVGLDFAKLNKIYQGEYMQDIDGNWITANREYYQKIYLKCCELLAARAMNEERYELGVSILKRALELDPYSERLNGMLIKNLGKMGEFQLAKQQYEAYIHLMKEELNLDIGKQVREIYQNTILKRIS